MRYSRKNMDWQDMGIKSIFIYGLNKDISSYILLIYLKLSIQLHRGYFEDSMPQILYLGCSFGIKSRKLSFKNQQSLSCLSTSNKN